MKKGNYFSSIYFIYIEDINAMTDYLNFSQYNSKFFNDSLYTGGLWNNFVPNYDSTAYFNNIPAVNFNNFQFNTSIPSCNFDISDNTWFMRNTNFQNFENSWWNNSFNNFSFNNSFNWSNFSLPKWSYNFSLPAFNTSLTGSKSTSFSLQSRASGKTNIVWLRGKDVKNDTHDYAKLSRKDALVKAQQDPNLEELKTGNGNGWKVNGTFWNDIPYARKGTGALLTKVCQGQGITLNISSALGTKTSRHQKGAGSRSHYNGLNPKLDFGGIPNREKAVEIAEKLKKSGLFTWIYVELNDDGKTYHLDVQFSDEAYAKVNC